MRFRSFESWLKAQVNRRDPVGHLAYECFKDKCCLKFLTTPAHLLDHINFRHSDGNFKEALKEIFIIWDSVFLKNITKVTPECVRVTLLTLLEPENLLKEGEQRKWIAWCPYCVDWHSHIPGNGLRAPLCTTDNPFLATGYRLKLSNKSFYGFKTSKRISNRPQISQKARFSILKRDLFTCQYCGRKAPYVELRIDHRISVKNGGLSSPENLVTSCHDCNSGKGDKNV